jgi:hypothetical protein
MLLLLPQLAKHRLLTCTFLPTRGHTSPDSATSEGESYLRLARTTGLLPPASSFPRATTEDAALDSYQNVLFSIARFRELTGAYPSRITVVGHAFKRRRFEQLHRLALRWPKNHFAYEGLPLQNEADEREAATGEVPHAPFVNLVLCLINPHNTASVGQRVCSVYWGLVRLPRAPCPKARRAELSHANSRLSCRCAGTTGAVGVVPQGRQTGLP